MHYSDLEPNNRISAHALTITSFLSLTAGDILVTPTGNVCVLGDEDTTYEEVTIEDRPDNLREFVFYDMQHNERKIIFVDEIALEYDIIVINGVVPVDTTTNDYNEYLDQTQYDEDYVKFIRYDRGLDVSINDLIEEE